ncbi:MAG TPA: carbon storage regulator CsrA [Spongiibacteraceae bacterium]|nr:carbon storage regulator CsrA [Spongiibacteraceae bacterium]
MLVLSRRTNETLVIDNNIRFTVLSVHGNQVRIGIEAPDDIVILREEIIDNTHRATLNAQRTTINTQRATATVNTRDNAVSNIKTEALPPASTQTTHGNQRGSEQGKRRGVLGLRRRRP